MTGYCDNQVPLSPISITRVLRGHSLFTPANNLTNQSTPFCSVFKPVTPFTLCWVLLNIQVKHFYAISDRLCDQLTLFLPPTSYLLHLNYSRRRDPDPCLSCGTWPSLACIAQSAPVWPTPVTRLLLWISSLALISVYDPCLSDYPVINPLLDPLPVVLGVCPLQLHRVMSFKMTISLIILVHISSSFITTLTWIKLHLEVKEYWN